VLSSRRWSRDDLAQRLGEPTHVVEGLLNGDVSITMGLARRLHDVIGASVTFWMTRDHQYQEDVARLKQMEREWLIALPISEMKRFGWIRQKMGDDVDVGTMLQYFNVSSLFAWHERYTAVLGSTSFKTSPTYASDPYAVAAWLRQGERVAENIACSPWNADALRDTLVSLRAVTRIHDPEKFLPKLSDSIAACGVAVVTLPTPKGCKASGATMWLDSGKALLMLSGRHLTDDHFWFTFYHECGHLLLHPDTRAFLESEASSSSVKEQSVKEKEASTFALDMLLPNETRSALRRIPLNTKEVLRLAMQAGIAPGILVGQLQHMGRLGPAHLNGLKRRFKWNGNGLVSRGKS